jgi:hypothetical protein
MIDAVKRLVERLEQLPAGEQEAIVRYLEQLIEDAEDRRWDELLTTPESRAFLDKLAAEADEEERAGRLIDLDKALAAEDDAEDDA